MKYSIPVLPLEHLYKEHTEFFGSQLEPLAFCEQIGHVMQKRKVTRNNLVEMTGLSPQRIGTILKMEGSDDRGRHVKRDHIYAVMIALRMDQCDYDEAMRILHYCFSSCYYSDHKRGWYIRFFVEHCATIEECTVANCNKALIDAGFEPLTSLLPDGKENT